MKILITAIIFSLLYAPPQPRSGPESDFITPERIWPHMPAFAWLYAELFDVPAWLMERVSYVESSHNPQAVSRKDCRGRYQFSRIHLEYYADMTGATIRGNWREFLHDDRKNCYLFAWSVRWLLNLGYTLEEIAQVHLFGHYAVTVDGRWSDRYNDLIFGKR